MDPEALMNPIKLHFETHSVVPKFCIFPSCEGRFSMILWTASAPGFQRGSCDCGALYHVQSYVTLTAESGR